ncbi:regulator of (H+)-ATPase in vacuolar membrane [Salix suchowensis]|nr:regulator of (H+)-ATPase in vacuolar membrane [Salix suchowensis]
MAWGLAPYKTKDWIKRDALLSISSCGELAFWVTDVATDTEDETWKCTGKVRTGRSNIRTARCSSAKKSALDAQSILAVGFLDHVDIYYQQRMTYFDDAPGWAICHRIDLSGQPKSEVASESLFEYVARNNGPLVDHHPQMVLQCLLWGKRNSSMHGYHSLSRFLGKVDIVKDIVVNLAKDIASINSRTKQVGDGWTTLAVDRFLEKDENANTRLLNEGGFSRPLVLQLLEALENNPLPHLTANENAHLLVLIQVTLEVDEQKRALDANGLRYLTTMRSFYILNREPQNPILLLRTKPPEYLVEGCVVENVCVSET